MKKRMIIFVLALSILTLSVPAAAKNPVLNKKKLNIKIGESYTLKVKNKGKKTIKWSSTKKKIASVNKKGVVTAKKKGKAKIRAKIGRKTLVCKVNVKKAGVTPSPKPNDNTKTTPTPKPNSNTKVTPTPKPNNNIKSTPTPKPNSNTKTTPTPKPDNTKATPDPGSIISSPTENPKKDDGWVPGWY